MKNQRNHKRLEKLKELVAMEYPKMFLFMLLFCSFAFAENWTLQGDRVFWQNGNALISVAPHTSHNYMRQVQYANFSWNGTPIDVNMSFVFDRPISYGKAELLQNVTQQVTIATQGRIGFSATVMVQNFTATNSTACQIGDADNAFRYNVTQAGNLSSVIVCFNSYSNVSNNYTVNYTLNGTIFIQQNVTAPQWVDISGIFTTREYGNYRVFTVNNVHYANPTLYQVRFTYDVPYGTGSGKFSIYIHAGSPDDVIAGTAPVYLLLDPWYSPGTVNLPSGAAYYLAYTFNKSGMATQPTYGWVNFSLNLSAANLSTYINTTSGANLRIYEFNNLSAERPFDIDSITNGVATYWASCRQTVAGECNLTVVVMTDKTLNNTNTTGTWTEDPSLVFAAHLNGNAVESAFNNNGTVAASGTNWQSGMWGQAVAFNSSGAGKSYVNFTHNARYNLCNMTIALWFYVQGSVGRMDDVVTKADTATLRYGISTNGGNQHSLMVSGGYTTAVADPNSWVYGVGTFYPGTFAWWRNYTDIGSTGKGGGTGTTCPTNNTNPLIIGANPQYNNDANFTADEVRIFNVVKSNDWIGWTYKRDATLQIERIANQAPAAPNLTTPSNGSLQYPNVNFTWQAATDPDNDSLTYYLCYGIGSPTTCTSNSSATSRIVNGLSKNSTYQWVVIANDGQQNSSNSSVWQLTVYNVTVNSVSFSGNPIIETGTQQVNSTLNISGPSVFTSAVLHFNYSDGSQQNTSMSLISGNSSIGVWQANASVLNVSGLVNVTVNGFTNATVPYDENSSVFTFYLDNTVPNATLIASSTDFIAPKNITFTVLITDDNLTGNATLYIGNESFGLMANATPLSASNNFTLTVQINSSGVLTAYAVATDSVGHSKTSANISMNVSNYTRTLSREMQDASDTLSFPQNKTFNVSLNYTVTYAFAGNSTASLVDTFTFPDGNVSNGRESNCTIANVSNGVNITTVGSGASTQACWVAYTVENVTVATLTDASTRWVNVTMPNYLNGTSKFYVISLTMPSSWNPSSQHVQIRTFRSGSWATVGDGNLQQGENVTGVQIYSFTTFNTTTYKDTVNISLDLSAGHQLEFTVQSGAEDTGSTPGSGNPGGGGGGPDYTPPAANDTGTQKPAEVPAIEGLQPLLNWIDGAVRSKVAGIPVYFIILILVTVFELVLSYVQAARNKIVPALAFIQIAVFFVTVLSLPAYSSTLVL